MSRQQTFPGMTNTISSPESVDGRMHSDSPDGRMIGPCGPDPALVNLSASQAISKGLMTRDTYGRSGDGSLTSNVLQLSLESRLRVRLAAIGSPEYVLTWKHWDMESGEPICALRASGRRTSGSGSGGWPTPGVSRHGKGESPEAKKARGSSPGLDLAHAAQLAGWGTPRVTTNGGHPTKHTGRGSRLEDQASLAGWVTPSSRDWKDTPGMSQTGTNPDGSKRTRIDQLPRQAAIAGLEPTSPVPTGKRGALNPALSRWLMGYPVEWDSCGATAMQLSRNSRQRS